MDPNPYPTILTRLARYLANTGSNPLEMRTRWKLVLVENQHLLFWDFWKLINFLKLQINLLKSRQLLNFILRIETNDS
jgi:hypothetical protein